MRSLRLLVGPGRHKRIEGWCYRRKILVYCATILLSTITYPLPESLGQGSPRRHHHVVLFESVLGNVAPEFSMIETSLSSNPKKDNLVTNRNRTYEAFTVTDTQLFVTERRTGKTFEIHGLPLEWRPFSDLVWVNSNTLVFDRWSQPHYGVHYAVDIKRKRLVIAKPFPDDFYLKQRPND